MKIKCIFHKEKNPSLKIRNNGSFKCYGCGKIGKIENYEELKIAYNNYIHNQLELKGQLRIQMNDSTYDKWSILSMVKALNLRHVQMEIIKENCSFYREFVELLNSASEIEAYEKLKVIDKSIYQNPPSFKNYKVIMSYLDEEQQHIFIRLSIFISNFCKVG